jgi:hypothetical protein
MGHPTVDSRFTLLQDSQSPGEPADVIIGRPPGISGNNVSSEVIKCPCKCLRDAFTERTAELKRLFLMAENGTNQKITLFTIEPLKRGREFTHRSYLSSVAELPRDAIGRASHRAIDLAQLQCATCSQQFRCLRPVHNMPSIRRPRSAKPHRPCPDTPHRRPATPEEIAHALSFALRYQGCKRVNHADGKLGQTHHLMLSQRRAASATLSNVFRDPSAAEFQALSSAFANILSPACFASSGQVGSQPAAGRRRERVGSLVISAGGTGGQNRDLS